MDFDGEKYLHPKWKKNKYLLVIRGKNMGLELIGGNIAITISEDGRIESVVDLVKKEKIKGKTVRLLGNIIDSKVIIDNVETPSEVIDVYGETIIDDDQEFYSSNV